jgi:hypothetical protein
MTAPVARWDARSPLPYPEFVVWVGRRAALDDADARATTVSVISALARILDAADRDRLLAIMPADLFDAEPARIPNDGHSRTGTHLVVAIGGGAHRAVEQARHRARAVLSALAGYRPDLVASLDLPPAVRELVAPALA